VVDIQSEYLILRLRGEMQEIDFLDLVRYPGVGGIGAEDYVVTAEAIDGGEDILTANPFRSGGIKIEIGVIYL
jgi:hypothetical protein